MIYYCETDHGNFGDDLNPWLWSRLAPEIANDPSPDKLFLGIGTILTSNLPKAPVKVVFGSGYGYGTPPRLDCSWKIYCLRGPLTAETLGLPDHAAVTDPAVLIREFYQSASDIRYPVTFMPHHQSLWYADWSRLSQEAGLHCIDPRQTVEQVISEIRATGLLVTEAMHGAIVADALRVPWVPVRLYPQFSDFKWRDWAQSLQLHLDITTLGPIYEADWSLYRTWEQGAKKLAATIGFGKPKWRQFGYGTTSASARSETLAQLARLGSSGPALLSKESVLAQKQARLLQLLQSVRNDWQSGGLRSNAYTC